MGRLIDMTVKDYLELAGSNAPAPGGGSVAALAGALSAAAVLLEPVARPSEQWAVPLAPSLAAAVQSLAVQSLAAVRLLTVAAASWAVALWSVS